MKVEKTNLKSQLSFTLCCDSRELSVFVMKPGYMASLILEGRVLIPDPIKTSDAGKKDPHNTLYIPKI